MVEVRAVSSRRTKNRKTMVTIDAADSTGRMRLTFFGQPWRARQLSEGQTIVVFGKADHYRGQPQMTNPIVDLIGDQTGRIVPVYPQSEKVGVTSNEYAKWIAEILRRSAPRGLADPVPGPVLERLNLIDRERALAQIHVPESMRAVAEARRRLVFDELLRMQISLVRRKLELERSSVGVDHQTEGELVRSFVDDLPFPLTGAQQRTIEEIFADMERAVPMNRLLQGDVGAGKTLVALAALLASCQGGHQGALMAPTAVLAEQHHAGISALLAGVEVRDDDPGTLYPQRPMHVALLTNRTTKKERIRLLEGLQSGSVDLLIGTHALIEDDIAFRSLGLVVVDEQHRFGVEQRAALREKGAGDLVPDVLVMTATPIPRTAAMTVYGDLDVSVLDELPPGRTPIVTEWIRTEDELPLPLDGARSLPQMWEHVRAQIAEGRQAYVVCPLVEESEKLEVSSAEETHEQLSHGELAGASVGLLHGRVAPADKIAEMDRFRSGAVDALVATTVIEVGVDVPNATVMVILDADRFGIAQLHQLRGRVGRGGGDSWCFLVGAGGNPISEARLQALVDSTDGFELAEVDLELRGEGTIMGERQKGRSDLKLASLRRDKEQVALARQVAIELVGDDPTLPAHPDLREETEALVQQDDAEFLLKS